MILTRVAKLIPGWVPVFGRDTFINKMGPNGTSTGASKSADELTQIEFDKQMGAAHATKPAAAQETPAEGTLGVHKNGKTIVFRNGKWEFADAGAKPAAAK